MVYLIPSSKRFQLDEIDWIKIGKGMLIAAGGAVLAYASEVLVVDLHDAGLVTLAAVLSTLINGARKLLANNSQDYSGMVISDGEQSKRI